MIPANPINTNQRICLIILAPTSNEPKDESRQRHKDALIKIEGKERFADLQQFFAAMHSLTSERRLSRIVYLVEKR